VSHRRTRPYTPRTNGKAERFIQTALREWAYRRPYYSSADRARVLPGWLEHYNCARPRASFEGRPPLSRVPGANNLMLAHT
jgi:transposase InsO family protein